MMKNYKEKFRKVWNDPVWSKVISAVIFAILSITWFELKEYDYNDVLNNTRVFLNNKIEVNYLALIIIGILNLSFIMSIAYLAKNYARPNYANNRLKVNELITVSESNVIDYCNVDKEVQSLRTIDFIPLDQSNLYYFLVNSYDGKETESIFLSKICKKYKIILEGAYEIMGRWDILFKFRYSGNIHIKEIMKNFKEELEKKGLIYKDNGKYKDLDRIVYYDVTREINPFGKSIRRRYLINTEKYLETRSQRGFMFIELHRDIRINFFEQLVGHLSNYQQLSDIIEYFSICRNDIIINFFMRCSQTSLIIILNNVIEEFLQDNDLDVVKHTFLCYTFNEPVLNN